MIASIAGLAPLFMVGCSGGDQGPSLSKSAVAAESSGADEAPRGQALSVQTVVPDRRNLVLKFEQPAPIVPCETAELYARASGYVKIVHVDIGDVVEEGQLLLELDVPDLEQDLAYKDALTRQAEAERDQARAAVDVADAALAACDAQMEQADADIQKADSERQFRERHAQRYAQLAKKNAAPIDLAEEKHEQFQSANSAYASAVAKRKALDADKLALEARLEAAKADVQTKARRVEVAKADRERTRVLADFTKLRAPFAGVITSRTVDNGALVSSGTSSRSEPIFTLARIDTVTAVLRVPEREVGHVRVGTRALMRLPALGGRVVEGSVARFSRSLNEKSRTMRVEIDIENPSGLLYPGMYGPVTLILREMKDALTIPASAVYAVGGQSFVIRIAKGEAHRLAVRTGYDDGKIVEVVDGLRGDEEIVVSNKGQIAEGQEIEPHRVELHGERGA